MNNDQKVKKIFLLLNVANVNVIYYIHSSPDLLECVYNNAILLKLFITQYTNFIQLYTDEINILNNKLAKLEESTLNPNAKDYIPVTFENENKNENIPVGPENPEYDIFNGNICTSCNPNS
jgi:hypothetical protein